MATDSLQLGSYGSASREEDMNAIEQYEIQNMSSDHTLMMQSGNDLKNRDARGNSYGIRVGGRKLTSAKYHNEIETSLYTRMNGRNKIDEGNEDDEKRKRRRYLYIIGISIGLALLVLIIGLSVGLTMQSDNGGGESGEQRAERVLAEASRSLDTAIVNGNGEVVLTDQLLGTGNSLQKLAQAASSNITTDVLPWKLIDAVRKQFWNETSFLSQIISLFPTPPVFQNESLTSEAIPKIIAYTAQVLLYGELHACDFLLFVPDYSSSEAVKLGTGLLCNFTDSDSLSGIGGNALSGILPYIQRMGPGVIAFIGDKMGSGDGGFSLSDGINLFLPVLAKSGIPATFKDFLASPIGQEAIQFLKARLPFSALNITDTPAPQCPDLGFDIDYQTTNLSLDYTIDGEFQATDALMRIVQGGLPCNPNGTKFQMGFDITIPTGGEIDLNLTAFTEFNNTRDFEVGLTFEANVRNLSFPQFRDYLLVEEAYANVTAVAAYRTFYIERLYFRGFGQLPKFGLTDVNFAARYDVHRNHNGFGERRHYGVLLSKSIQIDTIDKLICDLTENCGTLEGLSGMLVDNNVNAEIAIANAKMILEGKQLFAGFQLTLSGGVKSLPGIAQEILDFLNNPTITGSMGLIVPLKAPSDFVVWFKVDPPALNPYIPGSNSSVECNLCPTNPQNAVTQSTPREVVKFEAVRLDVQAIQKRVTLDTTISIKLSDKTLYFAVGGGLRNAEIYMYGRMLGSWLNVGGIKGLNLYQAGVEAGIIAAPSPILSSLGVWGGFSLGAINVNASVYFSSSNNLNFVFMGSVSNLNFKNLVDFIEDAAGVHFPDVTVDVLSKILDINVKNLIAYVAPKPFVLYQFTPNEIPIQAGLRFKGNITLFDQDVNVDLAFNMGEDSSGIDLDLPGKILSEVVAHNSSAFGPSYNTSSLPLYDAGFSTTKALINGKLFTIPDFQFSFSLQDVSLVELIPGWGLAEGIMDKVEEKLRSKATFKILGKTVSIDLSLINKVLDPVREVMNAAVNVVTINEFSVNDFSLYGMVTGTSVPTIVIDISVVGFDFKATGSMDIDFLRQTGSQMKDWLTNIVKNAVSGIRADPAKVEAWVEAELKHFKSQIANKTETCASANGTDANGNFVTEVKCIDFNFWH